MSESSFTTAADSRLIELELRIGIPSCFSPEVLANLKENVRTGLAWANSHASNMICRKVADGSLPKNGGLAERSYRAKVMVEMPGNRSRWLTSPMSSPFNSVSDMRKSEFNLNLFTNFFKHPEPLPPDSSGLSKVLRRTAEQVLAAPYEVTSVGFCLTVAYFKYDKQLEIIEVAL